MVLEAVEEAVASAEVDVAAAMVAVGEVTRVEVDIAEEEEEVATMACAKYPCSAMQTDIHRRRWRVRSLRRWRRI